MSPRAAALNVAAVMAADIDALLLDVIDRAQHAMAAMQARYRRIGKFGADAETLATVPEALDAYDEILRNATPLQMTTALKTSMRMVQQRQVIGAQP